MGKLLTKMDEFEEVSPCALYEFEFEGILARFAARLFPEYHLVPFKCVVYSEEGGARADYALVHRRYAEWWVLETEMAYHSLDAHVIPQVRILSTANYGEAEANNLSSACSELDKSRLCKMMKGQQPRVLVIVNKQSPAWIQSLKRYNAEVGVVELYRSQNNGLILRVDGFLPTPPPTSASECVLDPVLPGWLVIRTPSILDSATGTKVTVRYNNYTTEWQRIEVTDKVWLMPIGKTELMSTRKRYVLRRETDQFVLEER